MAQKYPQGWGIDTIVFTAHSTRAAAASYAARSLDIGTIMASVGWKPSHPNVLSISMPSTKQ